MSYSVAVRALCDFTARQGDLDLRFTPSPTAQQGMEGHVLVASRRPAGYQAEMPLAGSYLGLRVQGRADGYDAARQRVEEIKTHRGDLSRQPANHRHLHWAQVKVYGWLLCQQLGLSHIEVALVYFDIDSQRETVLVESASSEELRLHFEALCSRFLTWAEQESTHRQARDAALEALQFPHDSFRGGQRQLAEGVYNAARTACCLLAQAPTGIGKTLATLFPLLKACPRQGIDKLFFLTAKTTGRSAALHALDRIAAASASTAPPWRVIELVARDKCCEHPDKACHGDDCPLARGFYDRLPQAREAAMRSPGNWHQEAVRRLAAEHGLCPYYLSQELALWCDVAVGDYNHYFDLHAMLYAMAQSRDWRVGVLVDEAHNLLDRARKMYSAELDQRELTAVRRGAPAPVKQALDRLNRSWSALHRELPFPQDAGGQALPEIPGAFQASLRRALAVLSDHLADPRTRIEAPLQAFFLNALQFSRLLDGFDTHSLLELRMTEQKPRRRSSLLWVRNILPAPFLRPRLAAAHTATLFSATLSPWSFHLETLGVPEGSVCIDVPSPFRAAQLSVQVASHISTRFRHRAGSVQPIVELMGRQWQQRRGNYLAFFSSYDYLEEVADALQAAQPQIPAWRQSRRMSEAEQAQFIARFCEAGEGIGFAVLGGSFSEGIDLPGKRLIGAFIATLGMPQMNPANERVKQQMEKLLGQGAAYTYLYPGLQKVVQAAGRVIRSPEDEGVLHLMDDRFRRAEVRRLLPAWWHVMS